MGNVGGGCVSNSGFSLFRDPLIIIQPLTSLFFPSPHCPPRDLVAHSYYIGLTCSYLRSLEGRISSSTFHSYTSLRSNIYTLISGLETQGASNLDDGISCIIVRVTALRIRFPILNRIGATGVLKTFCYLVERSKAQVDV